MEQTKKCPDCGEVKSFCDFPKHKSNTNGIATYCKICHNARTRASVNKNGGARKYHLKKRYGITDVEVFLMIQAQNKLCAICQENEPTHLDHNHITNEVRGVLCIPCNNGLGLFRDRIELLEAAIKYLKGGQ